MKKTRSKLTEKKKDTHKKYSTSLQKLKGKQTKRTIYNQEL